MSNNSANNLEYYYNGGFGANNDDDFDIDIGTEDDLLQLLDEAKKHSSSSDDDSLNNNNNVVNGRGGNRERRRSWKKYLVSWYWKCSELEEEVAENKKRKRMGNYDEVQVQSGVGGGYWQTVVVLGRALRNSRNYYNDEIRRTNSSPSPYLSLQKLDVDNGNGGLSSSYYGPIYLVT